MSEENVTAQDLVGRVIDHFAFSDGLPVAAIEAALETWEGLGLGALFGAMLHEFVIGEDLSERTERALFVIVHLLAQKAETGSFADLCALGLDTDRLLSVLGEEGFVFSYPSLLSSTFGGDLAPVQALIEHSGADGDARCDGLLLIAYLVCTGQVAERQAYEYLAAVAPRLEAPAGSMVWFGYARAAATLGFGGLSGAVEALFTRGLIGPELMESADFWEDLRAAQQHPRTLDDLAWAYFEPIENAVEHMTALMDDTARDDLGSMPEPVVEPARNPLRNVGRNDPCPCGSGKKFKKCCLVAAGG